MDFMRKITCRGVVVYEGKLLAVKLKPYGANSDKVNDYWCIPGGKLDANESLTDNVAREMLEETGVAAEIGRLLYVQQFTHGHTEYIEFFFEVTNVDDYVGRDLTNGSHSQEEIAVIEFVDPGQVDDIKPAFFAERDLESDIHQYQGPLFFKY